MVKLYLDEDVHKKIATALKLKGYDVVSAHEANKYGLTDLQQLEFAVSERRAFFTFNVGDFSRLHKEFMASGKSHFGIILSKQLPFGETVKNLTQFLFRHPEKDIINGVFWI